MEMVVVNQLKTSLWYGWSSAGCGISTPKHIGQAFVCRLRVLCLPFLVMASANSLVTEVVHYLLVGANSDWLDWWIPCKHIFSAMW